MKTYSTIIKAYVTEKSSARQASGSYAFKVSKDSTKVDIKNAIKALYGVDVATVRTMLMPAKVRMIRGKYEFKKRPVFKKAIVTLKDKKTIDPNVLHEPKAKK